MQRDTRRPQSERGPQGPGARGVSGASVQGPKEAINITGSQELRAAARALDAETYTADNDNFFTQFRNTALVDKHRLLKTIQAKQQEAMTADAEFLDLVRAPIAQALRPRAASTDRGSNRSTANALTTCPLIVSGTRALERSKELLALYEEAAKAVDSGRDGLKGSVELEERWARDVEELRNLVNVGYKKAENDVARVLRGRAGGKDGEEGYGNERNGGDRDGAETGEVGEEAGALLFMSGKGKQEERERFNVTQTLYDAKRGVRRLSKSLDPEELP